MPFKQNLTLLDPSTLPKVKLVAQWLWMTDKAKAVVVQCYGNKMIDVYFDSREAAELFITNE